MGSSAQADSSGSQLNSKLEATPVPVQPKKKSAFYVCMEDMKSLLEELHGIRMTMAKVAQSYLMHNYWKNQSEEKKLEYAKTARRYNERADAWNLPQQKKLSSAQAKEAKALEEHQHDREIVWNLFSSDDWYSKPIVVCAFSTYFNPRPRTDEKYIPSEIGLTAFSLQDGVIDNYGRIIDPKDTIPMNRRVEAHERVKELGIPATGTDEEFQNYVGLVKAILGFLHQHCDKTLLNGTFYLFALQSDLKVTKACLKWIFEAAGCDIPVKVLDLSLYAHVASTVNNPKHRKISDEELAAIIGPILHQPPVLPAPLDSSYWSYFRACLKPPKISASRTVGEPFNTCFVHPSSQPMTPRGVFETESGVDAAVKDSDNYRYYTEFCCIYHMMGLDGAHHCALLSSNRYAFSLLEILTMSYKVDAVPGFHFPTVNEPEEDRQKRWTMLRKWGITQLEKWMFTDEGAKWDEKAIREHDWRQQRQQFDRLRPMETIKKWQKEQAEQQEKEDEIPRGVLLWPWARYW